MAKKFPGRKIRACITIHGGTQSSLALAMGKSHGFVKAMFYYRHVPRSAVLWFTINHPELFSAEDFANATKKR